MKQFLKIIALFSLSSVAAGAAVDLRCSNEARTEIKFKLHIENNEAVIKFDGGIPANAPAEARELANRKFRLSYQPSASARGWVEYSGDVMTDKLFESYRNLRIRFQPSLLQTGEKIPLTMLPSEPFQENEEGFIYFSYGMKCVKE